MEHTFYYPETGFPMADIQSKITETLLHLHADLGGIEVADEALFRMFELAHKKATKKETQNFIAVLGAIRCINAVIRADKKSFNSWVKELESIKTLP